MSVFDFDNYKDFVNSWIKLQPKNGRGELGRIARFLKVSNVLVSQVFRGDKEISVEQGISLAEYLGLAALETKYFIASINYQRAGNFKLKDFYSLELKELKNKAQDLSNRVKHESVLSEDQKTYFYSDWRISAARLMSGIPDIDRAKILNRLGLSSENLEKILRFLFETKLITLDKGSLKMGTASTHIGRDSPQVIQHHRNWRIKSINSIPCMSENELMYTGPMCVSKKLFEELKLELLKLIDSLVDRAIDSEPEDVFYLNIDLRKM